MKKYMVRLHGQKFLFNHDGEPKNFGFHAIRYLKAKTPQEAGKIAIVMIHKSNQFSSTLAGESSAHSTIDIDEVREVGALVFMFKKSTRSIEFYSEED